MLVLALVLFKTAEVQRNMLIQRIVATTGRALQEPLPENTSLRARYISYILNAPAWAGSVHMPWIFHLSGGTMAFGIIRTERDSWYLLFVILMWYIIGTGLDKWRAREGRDAVVLGLRTRTGRVIAFGYGIFVCYSAVEFSQSPWSYEWWFTIPVFVWGAGLIAFGLRSLLQRRVPA